MLLPTSKWSNLFHIWLHYITLLAWPKKLVSVPLPFTWSPEDEGSQSGFPVIFWLLRILSLISVRNFQKIVCDAWKPKRSTTVTGWKRRARPRGRPCCSNHMHCLLQGIREWESLGVHWQGEGCTGFEFLMQITCNYRLVKNGLVRHKDKLRPTEML